MGLTGGWWWRDARRFGLGLHHRSWTALRGGCARRRCWLWSAHDRARCAAHLRRGCGGRLLAQLGGLLVPGGLVAGALLGRLALPLGLQSLLFQGGLARLLGLQPCLLGLQALLFLGLARLLGLQPRLLGLQALLLLGFARLLGPEALLLDLMLSGSFLGGAQVLQLAAVRRFLLLLSCVGSSRRFLRAPKVSGRALHLRAQRRGCRLLRSHHRCGRCRARRQLAVIGILLRLRRRGQKNNCQRDG